MKTKAPSIKTLMQIKDVTVKDAKLIRAVIKADRDGLLVIAGGLTERPDIHLQRYNYINSSTADLRAELLDTILKTFGVEYLFKGSDGLRSDPESQYDSPLVTYLNAGDTYAITLLKYRGRWQVRDWGSIAEKYL